MKLTVEIPEHTAERVHAFIARSGRISLSGLLNRAILNELERTESATEKSTELADLGAQVEELQKGQRALIALVDSPQRFSPACFAAAAEEKREERS